MAFRQWFQPERMSQWRAAVRRQRDAYRGYFGRELRLARPRLFSEKMHWRKLFDLDARYVILSDKIGVRDFIARQIGAGYLPAVLYVGDDPDTIPFERLKPPYVVKPTHGSGLVMRVDNGALVVSAARETVRNWLTQCHGAAADEPGYVHVPRRVVVERTITERDGTPPLEHRMFAFDGRVRVTQTVRFENDFLRTLAFHDRSWKRLAWRGMSEPHPGPFPAPKHYREMIAVADRLAANFDHVRVDLYETQERIYAGELTVYSWSGFMSFTNDEPDRVLGEYWKLKSPLARAASAMLLRRREILRPEGSHHDNPKLRI